MMPESWSFEQKYSLSDIDALANIASKKLNKYEEKKFEEALQNIDKAYLEYKDKISLEMKNASMSLVDTIFHSWALEIEHDDAKKLIEIDAFYEGRFSQYIKKKGIKNLN